MNKTVQTTPIVKKYKDKAGNSKEITINHAKVKDRLTAFWGDNPRGKIDTSQTKEGKAVIFKAVTITDKKDEYCREATGHSYGDIGGAKDFEKLETIAVGRALALLGYATSGEIASVEEMEEFEKYKHDKNQDDLLQFQADLMEIKTIDDLREFYKKTKGKGKEYDEMVMNRKNQLTSNPE